MIKARSLPSCSPFQTEYETKIVSLFHDLLRIATNAGLKISEETEEWLDDISTFNINARYDNYKQDFYKLCTREFANMWSERIEKLRLWLIKEL